MKLFLLFFLVVPAFLFAGNTDKENLPKGQINTFTDNERTIDLYSHTDAVIFSTDIAKDAIAWEINGSWKISESCACVGLSGMYESNLNCRLVSPEIELPETDFSSWEKIALRFDEKFSLESGYDKGFVEISDDGGKTWTIINSRSGTTGGVWKNSCLFLDNYEGKTVRVAFRFLSDESFSGKGWSVKNMKVEKSVYSPVVSATAKEKYALNNSASVLSGTMSSLNSQNFPYIYMNVLISEDGVGVSNLTKNNFVIYENDTKVSSYNVVPPDASSGAKLVDIVFLVDNSGSFDDEQNAVRNNMESFVTQLASSGNDFALGLCRFGQSNNGGYPILEDDGQLTSDVDYFKNTVWLRNVTNGSKEVGYNAIVKSAQGFNFRPGAQKIFIILTDETPNQGGSTKQEATDACLNNYITLFAMTNAESAALNDIASATNGRSYDITDPFNDILNDISTSVNNNYLISYKSPNTTMDGTERQVVVKATNSSGTSTEVTGSYVPGAAPQIERTTETKSYDSKGWNQGTEFVISATITDIKEPYTSDAVLYYKHSADSIYSSVAMTNPSGDIWSASIPSSASKNPGVDYYITATDGNVTSSLPKVEPNVNPFQIGILPNEKPVITHTSPGSYTPGASVTFQASVTDNTNWVASVTLYSRSPGELLFTSAEMTNTSGSDYSYSLATSTSASGIEYYIVAEDDLGLKSYWADADSPASITCSGQKPNFIPYAIDVYNWASPLIVATTEDAISDASVIYESDEIFVSLAYLNNGNKAAGSHEIQLLVDGSTVKTWSISIDTEAGYINYGTNFSIGKLAAGSHVISFKVDSNNDVDESDETDNSFSKTITVITVGTSVADLSPYAPAGWSAPIVLTTTAGDTVQNTTFYDDQEILLNVAYANSGSGDAGAHVSYIYIDDTADTLSWTKSSGLSARTFAKVTDYSLGTFTAGRHIVHFVIDADNDVAEIDETDNEYSDTITVLSRNQPNLLPYQPSGWDAPIVVSTTTGTYENETKFYSDDDIYIDGAFENNGTVESSPYQVRIYVDSLLYTFEDNEGLNLTTYKYINDFHVGKLGVGTHEIKLFVDCFDDVAESDETDNMKTITINVNYPTGTETIASDDGVKVWPNPATNFINVDLGEPSNARIAAYSFSGIKVYETNTNNGQIVSIPTVNMPAGGYILHVVGDGKVFKRKIIVSK